jgi:NADH dehydrogenase
MADTIAITGATGFVGRHLVRRLAAEGLVPRCLVRNPAKATALLPPEASMVQADLLEFGSVADGLVGASTVIHCAAITADHKETFPGEYRRVNGEGTRNLVEAAKWAGLKRIVLLNGLGTRTARPGTYMSIRWEMAEAVSKSGLSWVALQPSILFGDLAPFQTAIARLARFSPVVPMLGNPELKFQPLWVEDLVTCLVRVTREETWDGRAIDLGGPEQLPYREVVDLILEAAGASRPRFAVPTWLATVPAELMKVLPNPPLTVATLELFDFDNITDPDSVSRTFGFAPRSMRDHFKAHGLE